MMVLAIAQLSYYRVLAYEMSTGRRPAAFPRRKVGTNCFPRPPHMNNSYAALEALFGLTTIQMSGLCRDSNRRPYALLASWLPTTPSKLPNTDLTERVNDLKYQQVFKRSNHVKMKNKLPPIFFQF